MPPGREPAKGWVSHLQRSVSCTMLSWSSIFYEQHRERLSTVSGAQFLSNHENFVRELALRQNDPTDGLDSVERDRFATFFSQCQRRYLAIMEKQAARTQ